MLEVRAADCELALRIHEISLRTCQSRLALGDVGAGKLTNLELLLRGVELLLQHAHVVLLEFEGGLVANHVHVGRYRAEEHVLLCRDQLRAARANDRLGLLDLGIGSSAAKDRLGDAYPTREWVQWKGAWPKAAMDALIAIRPADADLWPPVGVGLGNVFVRGPLCGSLGIKLGVCLIGQCERVIERERVRACRTARGNERCRVRGRLPAKMRHGFPSTPAPIW